METEKTILSFARLARLRAQGYSNESDLRLSELAFGIRFTYRVCVAVLIVAMATQSIALFSFMLCIAFLGVVLPNHPFDYIYNYVLSKPMHRPYLPPRSNQLKFACMVATLWLACTIYFMRTGNITAGLTMAAMLAGIAMLPSVIDLCIPSIIYNALFTRENKIN
jgi:hypothetical protein